jgi:tetratricopeptide (TPR) repeat protein
MLFEGIILTVMSDTGPMTEINLSKLDDTSAMKLSISLMTALGLGESQDQLNQLHGSFPVPGRKELALAYTFIVSSTTSSDPRIQASGRYCTLFLLFLRETKQKILTSYEIIEQVISKTLESVKNQDSLTAEVLKDIYTNIESVVAAREGTSAPAAIKQSAADLERFRIDQDRHQVLSAIIREITQIQSSMAKLLDELMVFTDTPIMEGAFYMRPNIKPEDFIKILPQVSRYEKILARLDGESKETVKEIVEPSVLVRIGNLFYWKAISSQQIMEYEKAIEFYMRANQLKDDSVLYLTIGSIYRKIGRSGDAKDWIEGGFSRMRTRKESIRISRNMLFGDIR